MAVVLEQRIGGATVRIHDDYCKDRSPEDVEKILRRIADFVRGEVVAAARESGKDDSVTGPAK